MKDKPKDLVRIGSILISACYAGFYISAGWKGVGIFVLTHLILGAMRFGGQKLKEHVEGLEK